MPVFDDSVTSMLVTDLLDKITVTILVILIAYILNFLQTWRAPTFSRCH